MKKNILSFSIILSIANSFAQVPNTDIWLLDVKTVKNTVQVTSPLNITNRIGYDNQPTFSPDGKYILYTSVRDEKQSDIYKYDIKTKTISQFTKTATSEYSPTFMTDGKNISVVMIEPDSAQRLWKFSLKGEEPGLIIKSVDSIGYHCWLDNTHVALFLITNPMKLIFTDITTEKSIVVKDTVGRSMHCIRNKSGAHFFYSQRDAIYSIDVSNFKTLLQPPYERVTKTGCNEVNFIKTTLQTTKQFKSEDFCFFNEYSIMTGNDAKLYVNYSAYLGCKDRKNEWTEIADLSNYGITNITRIAISPDGMKLAIVAETK